MKLDSTRTPDVCDSLWDRGENAGFFNTDLCFDEGRWFRVFELTTNHDGKFRSIFYPAPMRDIIGIPDNLWCTNPVVLPENSDNRVD